jgi:hypothetical protein
MSGDPCRVGCVVPSRGIPCRGIPCRGIPCRGIPCRGGYLDKRERNVLEPVLRAEEIQSEARQRVVCMASGSVVHSADTVGTAEYKRPV